jgi:hypothetical protein
MEEETLRRWTFFLERRGCPLRPSMLVEIANILLAERDLNKSPKKVGKNWVI